VARDALKNPEWRALYRYLQFRRQHDRRHWIITIASCTLSALVSAGLVSLLQQRSASEPSFEDRPALVAANLDAEVAGGDHQFELAGTGRPDLATFSRAPARPELTVEAALQEIIREQGNGRTAPKHQAGKNCDKRLDRRAGQSPQPAGERCAESSRQSPLRPGAKVQRTRPAAAASGKGPSRTLWSLLGLTAGPRPSGKPARHASIQVPRAAQQTRPSNALSNQCWTEEGGAHWAPCATRAGSQ